MKYVRYFFRYGLRVILVLLVALFLDYTLPSRDVVKIVGTEVVRTELSGSSWFWAGGDARSDAQGNRDIRFINTVRESGDPRVYRNEDTGWAWPPYFKFDSGDLQAAAQNLARPDSWVAVTHYGWRSKLASVYPNAISIEAVDGPGAAGWNWFRIIFLAGFAIAAIAVWRLWRRIRNWFADRVPRWRR